MATTRLGLYGGPRRPYGAFSGKEATQATTFFAEPDGTTLTSQSTDYATARAGTGDLFGGSEDSTFTVGQYFPAFPTLGIRQAAQYFDVSELGGIATGATLRLWPSSDNSDTEFTIEVRSYDWGESLEAEDFVPGDDLSALPLLASLSTSGISTGQYVDLTSEEALVTAINSARAGDGLLKLLIVSSRTTAGNEPAGSEVVSFYSGLPNFDPTRKPQLVITWELGPGERQKTVEATAALSATNALTVTATAALSKDGIGVQVVQVSAEADNRAQPANTTSSTSPGTFYVGTEDANGDPRRHHLWRFLDVPVGQGVTIQSAKVELRKLFTQHQASYWTWYGEASDNVTDPTGRIDTRPKTDAFTVENTNILRLHGEWHEWDVTEIVQEIVDRGGWQSGNNLALIADGNGPVSDARTIWYGFVNNNDSAAILTIQYQVGQQTRTVTATAALSATESRTVEATAALQATVSRTVQARVALSEPGRILNVVATASISHPDQVRTVAATAALSTAGNELTVAATAALMATFGRTVPATAALVATRALTVVATAALSDTTARELTVLATAALSRPVFVIPPAARTERPVFTLTVFGPLPGRRLVNQMALPANVALSFSSELPGGWARLSAGMIDPALRDVLTASQKQAMMLPEPSGAPAFGHVEIHTDGGRLVWEGRIATRADVGGEIRGLTALGYGVTALQDRPIPALSGPAQTDVVVRAIVEKAAPLIELGEVGNPGVQRDLSEFAGMLPYEALEALADTGCGTCPGWSWTVYDRALRFFALHPSTAPVYVLPADGTVSRDLDNEIVYTGVVLSFTDLDGTQRRTPMLRDHDAEDRYDITRILPLSGGQMTPSAALAFARTELLKRTQVAQSVRVERDWRSGLELAGSSGVRPVWEARVGETARVGDGSVRHITRVEYDAQTGRGAITLGQPASTDAEATWRRLVATDAAARSGRNPVTRTAQ